VVTIHDGLRKESKVLCVTLSENEIRKAIGLAEEGDRIINAVAPLGATADRCLYFVNKVLSASIHESLSGLQNCIVIAPIGSGLKDNLGKCVVLEVENPRLAIAKVLSLIVNLRKQETWLSERKVEDGVSVSPWAVVDQFVELGAGAVIEPFCVVEADVSIGRGTILRSGVKIHSRVRIGDHSVIGPNSVVGHPGYGFVRDELGNKTRIPHLGGVIVGSHVEIGALVSIPSGTISPTTVEDRAKIDDHVHVGHNVRVGKSASVTAGVVISGSAVVDEEAWIGVNSSIRDGRRVGSHCLVGMDSSIQQNIQDYGVTRAPRPEISTRPADVDSLSIGFK
jgi:UDP-3-O-[3-hydroxymyristoyl] glucosamine N-acyltransferase LpxD